MAGNTFGRLFRVTTWGESHGEAVGVVVDGCPSGIPLEVGTIQRELDRRRPGKSPASTPRTEADQALILSGVFNGRTTGTPILVFVANRNVRSSDYERFAHLFRPGHGDFTYAQKYGIRDWRGGGRASARETVARVAAGAIAGLVLAREGTRVTAYTLELGGVRAETIDVSEVNRNPFGCPDAGAVDEMERRVRQVKTGGDSIGGIVEIVAEGVPPGLGEPVFDKLDAELARALMGIGAVKGVEVGSGFAAARALGSENNDPITPDGFATNNAGGILAGISSGAPVVVRVAVKPISSISIPQKTIDEQGRQEVITVTGRHDVSAIPRINVVCEAMVTLVLVDMLLRHRASGMLASVVPETR
ncbi:chorismate synthase [Thermodesulfobacteriota bacterium]